MTLNKLLEDEALRSPKDYTIEISELVKLLDKNSDKILDIEYIVDDDIEIALNGKVIGLDEAIKTIELKEIQM